MNVWCPLKVHTYLNKPAALSCRFLWVCMTSQWTPVSWRQAFKGCAEAVAQRCSVRKMFFKISQDSQENTCDRVSFFISYRPEACNFIKKETLAQVLPGNFANLFRTSFLQNTSGGCFWWRKVDQLINYYITFAIPCMLNF